MSRFVKLSDIATLTVGYVGTMAKHYTESGVPLLRSLNIKPFKIVGNDMKYVSMEFSNSISKSILHEGDVIIVRTGIPGTCCVVPVEYDGCNCSDVVIVHPNTALVNPHYLAAFINVWGQKQVQNNKVGAIQQHFNVHSAEEMLIYLPDLDEQKRLAAAIVALNSKIENNNSICFELESMAKTIYDYWFTQFDFPDTDGKPYRSSGGAMEWNEQFKRKIPKEWTVGQLSDIANITMGQSPAGETYNENGDGKIFYQGCTDFGTRFPVPRVYTTAPTRFAKAGDILMSVRAPVGTLNVAIEDCSIGRGLAALNSRLGSQLYLWYTLSGFKQLFDVLDGNGTTFGSITKDTLYEMKVVIPSIALVKAFEEIVQPVEQKIRAAEQENRELKKLRDWLLPMLMNGQAAVVDAEDEPSKVIPFVSKSDTDQRFAAWLQNQGIAARGDIDMQTMREIFDAMDDDDK